MHAIRKEHGDRLREAADYGNLGALFRYLGECHKAIEYQEKALAIRKEIGDRQGEGSSNQQLGAVFRLLGKYDKAKDYIERALDIAKEVGHKEREGACRGILGVVFHSLREYDKAEESLRKASEIRKQIGDKLGEATDYANLGALFHSLEEYGEAKKYHKKAISISKETGSVELELRIRANLALSILSDGNTEEALSNLLQCADMFENMRCSLKDSDELQVYFCDSKEHGYPLKRLSSMLCDAGNPSFALNVEELRRGRALADLMSAKYRIANQMFPNLQSCPAVERILVEGINCTCLYIAYFSDSIFLWVLKPDEMVFFRRLATNGRVHDGSLIASLDTFFASDVLFRTFHILPPEHCEDRSWFSENSNQTCRQPCQKEIPLDFRLLEQDDDQDQEPKPSLSLYYKLLIAPVADLLDEPEIIIVPDRFLCKVPFAALRDDSGKYLSETSRIRIAPSLTTLKLIQDSPVDYHSETGALIVGDPVVGEVIYNGQVEMKKPLPCARKEAKMIGRLLGIQPLIGEDATKKAVLQSISSVSLVHFAAHGNAERGEIALAPPSQFNGIPQEQDYLLTMEDISQANLRAKLVVLSCCHSGSGQVRVEGIVGIARAFLGSGARSVLVALWALEDSATEQFMNGFYEHLVRGESASESLHQAMKWMRGNGYSDVRDWAPFALIGDDVTIHFGK